jgi:hypothetical protein
VGGRQVGGKEMKMIEIMKMIKVGAAEVNIFSMCPDVLFACEPLL